MAQFGRRRFLSASSTLLAAQLVHAQQSGRVYKVGVVFGGGPEAVDPFRSALVQQLARHGFEDARNLRIDLVATGFVDPSASRDHVRKLLAVEPDVLVAWSTFATDVVRNETKSVPVVFTWVADPIAAGFVESYAKPGGNITGVSNRYGDMFVKRLELAVELLPGIKRVAILNTESRLFPLLAPRLQNAAAQARVELLEVPGGNSWDAMIEQAVSGSAGAALPHYTFAGYSMDAGELVIRKAGEHRLPVVFTGAELVEAGGLISYGTRLVDDARRCADQVARLLKGANPAALAVDQASTFELAVNLRTAKALGVVVPQSILVRADRVVE